jgi:hypothetical protein
MQRKRLKGWKRKLRKMNKTLSTDLSIAKQILFSKLNYELKNIEIQQEGEAYNACTFELNDNKILYREAKITPTKIGLFVTIWKRNKLGVTEPFDIKDEIDFVLISCRDGDNFGLFFFQ